MRMTVEDLQSGTVLRVLHDGEKCWIGLLEVKMAFVRIQVSFQDRKSGRECMLKCDTIESLT